MIDTETVRPAIIACAIYLVMIKIVPTLFKTPPQNKVLADLVKYANEQQKSLLSGMIMISMIVLGTNYMQQEYFA